MPLCKTEGIVLRTRRQGETSKILVVYTRDYGKISLIAKGSRSIKSRYWGALEPFTHIALVFYRKENRELQYSSQADIIKSFASLRLQLGKIILASTICELVNKIEIGESANPQLFQLILQALSSLDHAESGVRNVVRSFQVKLLSLLGYEPHLAKCAQCDKTELYENVSFDLDIGSYVCHDCHINTGDKLPVSSSAIEYLRWFQQVPVSESPKARMSAKLGREIDAFLQSYLQYHIEGLTQLKSIRVLEQIDKNLKN